MPTSPPSPLPYLAQLLLRPSPLHPDPDPTPSAEAYLQMWIHAFCSAADPDPDEALRLLDCLRLRGYRPNGPDLAAVLRSPTSPQMWIRAFFSAADPDPDEALRLLDCLRLHLRLGGYRPNGPDLAAILRALCSLGRSVEAYRRLLLHLCHAPSPSPSPFPFPFPSTPTASSSRCAPGPPPDAVSYTTLLNGYARLGDADVARRLLDEMPYAGVAPNSLTRTVLVKALLCSSRLEETRQLMLRLWPAMEHQQRRPYDGNGLLHPRGKKKIKRCGRVCSLKRKLRFDYLRRSNRSVD